jgi:HD-GYP domain-containing protein (c-di-GMP phosphodiesterase class II)
MARIIGVVDQFYEIKKNHDILLHSHEIFENNLNLLLKKFDINIITCFLKNAELFSPDTLLRFTNDDIGIVTKNNESDPLRPYIKVIKSRQFKVGEEINLYEQNSLRIKNIEYYIS